MSWQKSHPQLAKLEYNLIILNVLWERDTRNVQAQILYEPGLVSKKLTIGSQIILHIIVLCKRDSKYIYQEGT
jgi:hypothetical protein